MAFDGISDLKPSAGVPAASGSGLSSGTYTPALTNAANVASSTAYLCFYHRVLNRVIISGQIDIAPTANGAATIVYMSLPVAFDVATVQGVLGTASAPGVAGASAAIYGDVTGDRAIFSFVATANTSTSWIFQYSYISPNVAGAPLGTIIDDPYSFTWDGKVTSAPSQNAVYDKIQAFTSLFAASTYTFVGTAITNVVTGNGNGGYIRMGSGCVVWGGINVDPVAAGDVQIGISLPIASDLITNADLGGVACAYNPVYVGGIYADTTNNQALLQIYANTTTASSTFFIFGYRILP